MGRIRFSYEAANPRGVKDRASQMPVRKDTQNNYTKSDKPVATNIERIGVKARECPKLVFTSLYHHVTDIDNLRAAFHSLKGDKAVGIDRVSKTEYGRHLEENLKDLSDRLGRMGYRPQPKKRSYVPKTGSAKGRPLGISVLEDKIVEKALKNVLEPIYEEIFLPESYGYRPKRRVHHCIDALGRTIQQERINYVAEADIRGFFDHVDHQWMVRCLHEKIRDKRIIRLIQRMLKAGIMEDGELLLPDEGTPQGSCLSPLLSNIYLHYVLDLWVTRKFSGSCQGVMHYFRYADDFLICFQYQTDAERFLTEVKQRLKHFNLDTADEFTRIVPFGRYARKDAYKRGTKPKDFTFLGFTFYCGRTRFGGFKVKRKTAPKKMRGSLNRLKEWLQKERNYYRTGELMKMAKQRVLGHLNAYSITDNYRQCNTYVYHAKGLIFKWLNRRSQKRSYNWDQFKMMMRTINFPAARITLNLNPFSKVPNI